MESDKTPVETTGEESGLVLSRRTVAIVGDYLLDRYVCGTVKRLSPEAPIVIVNVDRTFDKPGGAGNVAANLAALMNERLTLIICDQEDGLPIKNRLMVGDTQLARWDEGDAVSPADVTGVFEMAEALVISDYCKGSIDEKVLEALWYNANTYGARMFVDTKRNPSVFPPSAVFFPNLKEYSQYQAEYDLLDNVVLKCSADGLKFLRQGRELAHVPALAKNVRNVNGAGDTVLAAVVSNVLDLGELQPRVALELAAKAAAIVVQKPYTAVCLREELL